MSDEGISEDDWRAEIDRLAATPAIESWHQKEVRIVRYGYGKVKNRETLLVLNKANVKAGRKIRSLSAVKNFILDHKDEWEEDDVRHT